MCPSLYFFLVRVNVFMPDSRFIKVHFVWKLEQVRIWLNGWVNGWVSETKSTDNCLKKCILSIFLVSSTPS